MNTFKLNSSRVLEHIKKENLYERENKITSFKFILPETIGNYNRADCEIELRCYIEGDDYIPYAVDTDNAETEVVITTDLTETAQIVPLMLYITHSGEVIGKTNEIPFVIHNSKADTPPLTPREEFDTVIREQRAEIAEQTETINSQAAQIEQDEQTISGLNTQVSELTTQNEQLETQHTADQNTIQYLIENPPEARLQPKSVTPTASMQVVEPDEGYQGLSTVTVGAVAPPRLQGKAVSPTNLMQNVQPDNGYDGLSNVAVAAVTAQELGFDYADLKEGVSFLGGIGTYNPFPENSYGGIYYTELGEGGYPKKILIKDMLRSASTIPQFFDTSNDAKRELREVIFENCPGFLTTAAYLFQGFNYLTKVLLPDSLTSVSGNAFNNCTSLTELTLPDSLTSIGGNAFLSCTSLTELTLPDSLTSISASAFQNCTSLTELTLPDSLTSIGVNAFYNCTSLTGLILAQGFNCNGLNVSWSTRLTAETIVACLEALADRTGQTAYTLTIGSTNLNKMTAEEKAIATNKNWNLA